MGVGLVYAAMDLEELPAGESGHEGEECKAGQIRRMYRNQLCEFCLL